ncbi:redoxin domain-containing protein [Sinomicrobium sp. M5D2P9]
MKKLSLMVMVLGFLLAGCNTSSKKERTLEDLKQMDSVEVKKEIEQLLESDDEKDYQLAVNYYRSTGNNKEIETIMDKAIAKFPKGEFAAIRMANTIYTEKDPDLKIEKLNTYRSEFPDQDPGMAYFDVTATLMEAGRKEEALAYYDKNSKKSRFRYYATKFIVNGMDDDSITDKLNFVKEELKNAETYLVLEEGNRMGKEHVFNDLKLSLANLTEEAGNPEEAVNIIGDVYTNSERKSNAVTLTYAAMLTRSGDYEKAFPLLEKAVSEGIATKDIKEYLKLAYTSLRKKDYDGYLKELQSALAEKTKEHLKEIMVDKPSPSFELRDAQGKPVTNEDLKGKILVLDFWATWCGPCKKSFPGMQMAVNKYKNDPQVKFLFVHTFEKGEDSLTEAQTYLEDNNYDFDLYMDYKNQETKENNVAKAFGINGIPTKVIIDAQGNIRFQVVGFSGGGDDTLVEELSAMIEMAGANS